MPATTQRTECAHGSARGIRARAIQVVTRDEELTVRVQYVREGYGACPVSAFGEIPGARQRSHFTL
jgi:hypothetical protein